MFDQKTGWELGQSGQVKMGAIHRAAAQVGTADEATLAQNLTSKNASIRYWAALGLVHRNALKIETKQLLRKSPHRRIPRRPHRGCQPLAHHGDSARAAQALIKDLARENLIIVTHAARTIELLGEKALNAKAPMAAALKRAETIRPNTPATVVLPGDKDLAMFVAFSCRAFCQNLTHRINIVFL